MTEQPANGRPEWIYHPPLPIKNSPLFSWPLEPLRVFRYFARSWLRLSDQMIFAVLAIVTWFALQPPLEACRSLELTWIAQVYARNLGLMVLAAGGLHLYFFTFRKQGRDRKYDPRWLTRDSRTFTLRNQVFDNMIWTCASGVTVWSAYEVLLIWGYANGYAPLLAWSDNPIWFLLLFPLVPIWTSFHFYWVHRFLHWKPLYKLAHALHHRNVNIGPWSGLSMHPLEHVIYLSSVLIHWVVAAHPIHVFFHMYFNTLGAVTSHTGYESLLLKDRPFLDLGSFHHQLHHRYFECNYGNTFMPWDKWFGSFHDGTPEATRRMRTRLKERRGLA